MFQKTLFLFLIIFLEHAIQAQTNSLVVLGEKGTTFNLMVNNELINKTPQTDVKANNLTVGWQTIKIIRTNNGIDVSFSDSIFIHEKYVAKEFTYVLSEKGKKLYFNSIAESSSLSNLVVPEVPKIIMPVIDNKIYGNVYQTIANKPVFFNNYDTINLICMVDLNDQEIQYALKLCNKCNDEETKLTYIYQIINHNCYSCVQLKKLIEILPIETDKLRCVKQAYAHITDKQNYASLLPVLKYPSVKEAFIAFVKEEDNITKQRKLGCKDSISEGQFTNLLLKIKQCATEHEKLATAKKSFNNMCHSCNQSIKILNLFTHDREKLEFSKSVYHVLTDKDNVNTLVNEFQFNETKNNYLKFISQQ